MSNLNVGKSNINGAIDCKLKQILSIAAAASFNVY